MPVFAPALFQGRPRACTTRPRTLHRPRTPPRLHARRHPSVLQHRHRVFPALPQPVGSQCPICSIPQERGREEREEEQRKERDRGRRRFPIHPSPTAPTHPPPPTPPTNTYPPHAPGLLPHPNVSTTLRRWDAGAGGRPNGQPHRPRGRVADLQGKRTRWVAGGPRQIPLDARPNARDTPLDTLSRARSRANAGAWAHVLTGTIPRAQDDAFPPAPARKQRTPDESAPRSSAAQPRRRSCSQQ